MERDAQLEPGAFRTLTSAWRHLPDFLVICSQRSGSSSSGPAFLFNREPALREVDGIVATSLPL